MLDHVASIVRPCLFSRGELGFLPTQPLRHKLSQQAFQKSRVGATFVVCSSTGNSNSPRQDQSAGGNTFLELFRGAPARELRVGGIVIPRHLWNRDLRRRGIFRSVEYRLLNLRIGNREISSTEDLRPEEDLHNVQATIRPLRKLVPEVEALFSWPVSVSVGHAVLWSYKQDLLRCFSVALFTSFLTLSFGIVGPHYLSVYYIQSLSMFPTLDVGDGILVEKLSLRQHPPLRDEILFFQPPGRLLTMIHEQETMDTNRLARLSKSEKGGDHNVRPYTRRIFRDPLRKELFVKRIAAVPGDSIFIANGNIFINGNRRCAAPAGVFSSEARTLPEHYFYVLGDNSDHSLDSRYWGLVREDEFVGRPLARIWPVSRVINFRS